MERQFDESWDKVLVPLFEQEYMRDLSLFVKEERKGYEVYPPNNMVFSAFRLTPLDKVKVVILGQDPYHNVGQAHGLSFSVPVGLPHPPSLRNIFTELTTDIDGFTYPESGDLTKWAEQGVLLLNATLTVRAHEAGSHQKKGWERMTDEVITRISAELDGVVFLLWGAYAQKKAALIDPDKHLILKAVHPSPLSAYRGFFGSKHFSKANTYLAENGKGIIQWQLC